MKSFLFYPNHMYKNIFYTCNVIIPTSVYSVYYTCIHGFTIPGRFGLIHSYIIQLYRGNNTNISETKTRTFHKGLLKLIKVPIMVQCVPRKGFLSVEKNV